MEKTAPGWLENPLLEGRGGAIIGSRKFAKETPWLGPKEVGKIREGTLRDAIVGTQRWPIILPSLRQSNKFHVNGILFGSHSSIPPDQSFRSFSLSVSKSISTPSYIFARFSLVFCLHLGSGRIASEFKNPRILRCCRSEERKCFFNFVYFIVNFSFTVSNTFFWKLLKIIISVLFAM